MNRYQLLPGDSRNHLQQIPDQSVDMILTDPPYNLGRYSTGNIKMGWRKDFNNDIASWDYPVFHPADWLADFQRVLKPRGNIFAFTSYNLLGKWHEAFDPVFDTFQFMVWHKTNPPPKLRKAGFLNSCELIVCAWNEGHTWNFAKQNEMHNFIESSICMGNERLKTPAHPTQKPLKILKQLIQLATEPGQVVLDPFMGVGSSGVAALELDRRFIGVEIEPLYFEAAARRIETAQSMVFAKGKRQATIDQVRAAIMARGWTPRIRTRREREYVYAVRRQGTRIEEKYLGALEKYSSGEMQACAVAQHLELCRSTGAQDSIAQHA
jgi:site-specific DNA-methyltransferase (adenine-specific)/modification methylase